MLKSLREALAKYAAGDEDYDGGEIVAPIGELEAALVEEVAVITGGAAIFSLKETAMLTEDASVR